MHSKLLGVTRACLCFARAVSVAVAVAVSVAVASLTWESPGCLVPIVVVSIIIIIAHKLLSNYMYMYVCVSVCVYVCLHTVTGFALSVNFGWFYWPASTFLSAGIASDGAALPHPLPICVEPIKRLLKANLSQLAFGWA